MSVDTLALAMIVTAAVAAQLLAVRLRVPAIIPLLVAGVALGDYGLEVIEPDALLGELLTPFVNLAIGVILFDGATGLRRRELGHEGIGSVVARLLSLGVLLTWAAATAGAALLLDLDFRIAVILGAVLTLSGPTVVLPLLDFVRPAKRVGTILRWEGILVDPVGAIIAVLTFGAVMHADGGFEVAEFAATVAVGAGVGVVGAVLLGWILRSPAYSAATKTAATLGLVLAANAVASAILDDAGLVAAITMGAALANGYAEMIEETAVFTETLVTLLIGALFVVLSARVDPGAVADLGIEGLLFVGLLVVLVRPLAVVLSTTPSHLERREKIFLAWMMPRGIVAAATVSGFQLRLEQQGIPDADLLVPATFLVIAATVVVYGLTARPLAAALDLREPDLNMGEATGMPGMSEDAKPHR